MSAESKKDIETELKSCAEGRRFSLGHDLELHPANRRLLHDELARQFGLPPRTINPAHGHWLAALWPRFAFGAILLLSLALATMHWLPRIQEKNVQLALVARDESRPVAPGSETRQLVESDTARPEGVRTDALLVSPPAEAVDAARSILPAVPPAPAAGPSSAANTAGVEPRAGRKSEFTDAFQLNRQPASQPESARDLAASRRSTANPPTPTRAREAAETFPAKAPESFALSENRGVQNQFFQQATPALQQQLRFQQNQPREALRRNFNSPPPTPVLNTFQFEQNGAAIRVIDADGSVYEGSIVPSTTPSSPGATQSEALAEPVRLPERTARRFAASPLATQQAASQAVLNFQAEGTNRTLNQRVVFRGQMLGLSESARSSAQSQSSSTARILPQTQILGTAVVGRNTAVPIQAEVKP